MQAIEEEAIDGWGVPLEQREACQERFVLQVKTEDMINWLRDRHLLEPGSQTRLPKLHTRFTDLSIWFILHAREPLALVLLLGIFAVDVVLLAGVILGHFHVINIFGNSTQF